MSTEQDWTSECPTEVGVYEWRYSWEERGRLMEVSREDESNLQVSVPQSLGPNVMWRLDAFKAAYSGQWRAHKGVEAPEIETPLADLLQDMEDRFKDIYNTSSFDWDTMPEEAKRKYREVMLDVADKAIDELRKARPLQSLETRLAEAERELAGSESCHFETEQEWRSIVELLDGSTTEECLASLHKLKAERDAWKGVAGRLGDALKEAVNNGHKYGTAMTTSLRTVLDEALAELEKLQKP